MIDIKGIGHESNNGYNNHCAHCEALAAGWVYRY
jgi:hypothetical protein